MMTAYPLQDPGNLQSYYEKESGQEGYWQKEAKEATTWMGKGAAALGLAGAVDPDQFQELMEGRLPDGTQLPAGAGGAERRPGYDATFSAPKSVSIAAVVGGDDRIFAAHDNAIRVAFDDLERRVAQARIKQSGITNTEQTGNLVAAVFRHQTSRALDPHLHTHAIISNTTMTADGKWRAFSPEELFKYQKAAGAVYRAELGKQLRELGYELRQTKDAFEISEISENQIEAFSTRRAEVLAALEASGHSGAKAAEIAARASRADKVVLDAAGRERLAEDWQSKASAVGLDIDAITAAARGREPLSPEQLAQRDIELHQTARAAVDHAVAHLSERQSVFTRRDVITHAANHGAAAGVDLTRIEAEIERRLQAVELVRAGERLTTQDALRTELRMLHSMRQGQGTLEPIAAAERVEQLTEGLTAGQAEAVKLALTTRDQVIGVQGYAGTGKTTMLQKVVQEAQAEGFEVTGLAPSAQAAKVLEQETGAESKTLAKHLLPSKQEAGAGKHVWIVDEAGMMSAKQADQLLAKARAQGARVILVGDRQQLSAVEAGEPFAVLSDKGMATARMDEIMRQRDAQLKQAVESIIQHRGAEAIEKLAPQIQQIESRDERLAAVAKSYLSHDPAERAKTLVIVETNRDRQELNQQIREGLRAEGQLRGERVEATQLVKASLTKAQAKQLHNYQPDMQIRFSRAYESMGIQKGETLAVAGVDQQRGTVLLRGQDGRQVDWNPSRHSKIEAFREQRADLQQGDQIRFTRNEYDLGGRLNGHQAEVLGVDREARTAQIRLSDGKEQTMHLDSKQEQTWTHSYSSTVHAAQGATCDKAIIAVDTEQRMTSEQSAYVAISRARDGVEIHVDDRERLAELAARQAGQESALEAVEQAGHHPESVLDREYHTGIDAGNEFGREAEEQAHEMGFEI